jgi:thiamine-monophosphate kinase
MLSSPGWRGSGGTPIHTIGEFGLFRRLRQLIVREEENDRERSRRRVGPPEVAPAQKFVVRGIGDDAALLAPRHGMQVVVTCDVQVEGRHFVRRWLPPRDLGARCATVNLSDIAAMGGAPRAAFVSLLLDDTIAVEDVEEIYRGMLGVLRAHDAVIAGGNVGALPSGVMIDITLVGEVEAGLALRRDGARPGDILWVTGAPGSAAAGYQLLQARGPSGFASDLQPLADAYLSPVARIREGRALAASGAVSAAIDVSDGLLGDARHLIEDRDLDLLLRAESLPIGEELFAAAQILGSPPRSFLEGPSDDYELLFTTAPSRVEEALRALRQVSDVAAWPIGEVLANGTGRMFLEEGEGERRLLEPGGWDHFRGTDSPESPSGSTTGG